MNQHLAYIVELEILKPMLIRKFQESDIHQVVLLFYETVHSVNAVDYSIEQLNAWAPQNELKTFSKNWNKSLRNNISYVIEINNKIVGFSDLTYEGYLNRLYVHKDFQEQNIATNLVNKLETIARENKLPKIYTEASITAKPFFENHGYQIISSQNIERKGITLPNFLMIKELV